MNVRIVSEVAKLSKQRIEYSQQNGLKERDQEILIPGDWLIVWTSERQ